MPKVVPLQVSALLPAAPAGTYRPADIILLRDLVAIAHDRALPAVKRTLARVGARAFARWMRAGGVVPRGRIPIYGRYCGPGCSGPGEPVDCIDAACRRHDAAYRA